MKLRNFQVRDSINSLNRLDGFIFKSGRTHYNLAKQLKLLQVAYEPTQDVAKKLQQTLNGDRDDARAREYSAKVDEILQTEVEIDRIYKVPMSELLEAKVKDAMGVVHQAAVPVPTLKELEWMIEDDVEKVIPPS